MNDEATKAEVKAEILTLLRMANRRCVAELRFQTARTTWLALEVLESMYSGAGRCTAAETETRIGRIFSGRIGTVEVRGPKVDDPVTTR